MKIVFVRNYPVDLVSKKGNLLNRQNRAKVYSEQAKQRLVIGLVFHVGDFDACNRCLTAKLLKQVYRCHKLNKAFSKFYRRHYELISNFSVGLKSLLHVHQGLSETEFYGDLVYKIKKIMGRTDFSDHFRKIIIRHKRIGYDLNVMRQSA